MAPTPLLIIDLYIENHRPTVDGPEMPWGTGGEEQARLVLKHLADAGYSLVAEDCSPWGWAGVFTNAAGESLQASVSERSQVSLMAGIGMDHQRLPVSEVPLLDRYESHDCWPSP